MDVDDDAARVSAILSRAISDAFRLTLLKPIEEVQESFRTAQVEDLARILHYKNLTQEQLWTECAQHLTTEIQLIIEFTKMIPHFLKLIQGDQIILLRSRCFEMAVVRLSRHYDLKTGCVLYMDTMLPQDAFFTHDTAEQRLVSCIFELARSIAEFKLTETELALFSAAVLLDADQQQLRGQEEVKMVHNRVIHALRSQLSHSHESDPTVCDALIAKLPQLKQVSVMHAEALARFKRSHPRTGRRFAALYEEMFSPN